jgi:chromosome partitioning protein
MAKIVAMANQKGGVGKTTSCVNLAASLVVAKRRVLLVDLDPQGNATMGSGISKYQLRCTTNEVLLGTATAQQAIITETPGGYHVMPANARLTEAEIGLLNQDNREKRLKMALNAVKDVYDYILIDCPPSLNMLTVNGLVAAHSVIIPMQCEYYALEGLTALVQTIQTLTQSVNPGLTIEGLLRTMYDPRNGLAQEVTAQLIQHFGNKVYKTVIPRNVRLAEAPSHGLPVLHYDKYSRGAACYLSLAGEFLKRQPHDPLYEAATIDREPADA